MDETKMIQEKYTELTSEMLKKVVNEMNPYINKLQTLTQFNNFISECVIIQKKYIEELQKLQDYKSLK
jgi:hypothetical protein